MEGINCEGLSDYIKLIDGRWSKLSNETKKEILSTHEVEWDEFLDAEKIEIYENEISRKEEYF